MYLSIYLHIYNTRGDTPQEAYQHMSNT
jgi:hypothetical protein